MSATSLPDGTSRIRIAPRFLPRGVVDFLVSAAVGLFQCLILFGVPASIAYFLTRSTSVALLASVAAYIVFLLFAVRYITLSIDGIQFHRVLGTPKFLPWGQITSIERVSRSELVFRGWLWPLFPPREITASLSSLGHFRIRWPGGFCYYPPRDALEFERHVSSKLRSENA